MTTPELDAHTTEQDRQDQLEEDRLLPIYRTQREVLEGFAQWLNDQHPSESPYTVWPKKFGPRDGVKPYLDAVMSTIECKDESNEIDFAANDDAYLILWTLYQKRT